MSWLRQLILFTGVLVFISGVYPGDARPADAQGLVLEKKTLTRVEDFVVVHGKILKKNLGRDIGQLGLFAFLAGKLAPIPFQIDELNSEGDWVLTQVPPELKNTKLKPERDNDDGNLDNNDELVFMARDAGDRIKREYSPPGALAVDEIMLRDPVDGGKAWVYLGSFSGKPPLSDRDYVEYVLPGGRIKTQIYEMDFPAALPIAPGYLSIHGSPNIVDRMKIREEVKLLGIKFSLTENSFVSELSLYKDGPIRVIRRTRNALKFIGIFRTPSAAVENIFYENISLVPIRIKIPFSVKTVKKLIGYIKARAGADYQNLHGWRIKTEIDPNRWFNIDGKMDEAEKSLEGKPCTWFLISGPPGAFLLRMISNRMPDGSFQNSPIKSRLYYVDDDLAPDPPEFVPGQSPNVEFYMDGIENLEKGTLYLYAIEYIINDYTDGKEKDYLNILDKSLEVSAD